MSGYLSRAGRIGGLIIVLTALAACQTAPATGKNIFTGFMSLEDEKRVGAEEHPKILESFGGPYEAAGIPAYINRIGQALVKTSELPNYGFRFTVLNSDQVNAFALPGGYVYVTRGLMALAGDEAELAGVIAHEIGHVTARHSAERYGDALATGLGATVLGAVLGSSVASQAINTGANLALKGFSRQQEFEADTLGVRYLSRSGYADEAMASFLTRMRAHSALEAKIQGQSPDSVDQVNLLATHPRAIERVQAAIKAAGKQPGSGEKRGRVAFLTAIDGMLFGDDPKEGFVRGREFIHPELLFKFQVPEGFRLINGKRAVVARGPSNSAIRFDMVNGYTGRMTTYLSAVWGKKLKLRDVEQIVVNGMAAATGSAQVRQNNGTADLRLVAIRQNSDRIYRFMFLTPTNLTSKLNLELRRTTFSMTPISAAEAAKFQPLRVRIRAVSDGDTVASLARLMAYDDLREERFRVLNGLEQDQQVRKGQLVKIITERSSAYR